MHTHTRAYKVCFALVSAICTTEACYCDSFVRRFFWNINKGSWQIFSPLQLLLWHKSGAPLAASHEREFFISSYNLNSRTVWLSLMLGISFSRVYFVFFWIPTWWTIVSNLRLLKFSGTLYYVMIGNKHDRSAWRCSIKRRSSVVSCMILLNLFFEQRFTFSFFLSIC